MSALVDDRTEYDRLEHVMAVIDAIPEPMCGGTQPRFLYELSRRTNGRVVEIGTCAGKSTIALAYGQQQQRGPRIYTIDIATHPMIDVNLRSAGVACHRILGASHAVAATWSAPIALLWIDGDHSYRGVLQDIVDWSPFVQPGGLMAFHDFPSPGGKVLGDVGRAVYETVFKRPDLWRVVADREAGSILVVERRPDAEPGVPFGDLERVRYHARVFGGRVVSKLSRLAGWAP